jgi:hypothetical protein
MFVIGAVLAVLLPLSGSPVSAHHGEAGAYELDQTIKLQGIVREVRWANPHVIIAFDVKGASGVEQWSIELSSISTTEEAGGKRDALSAGDQIVVTGHRRKDTKLLILPRTIQRPDGTTAIPVPVRRGIFGAGAK